MFTKLLNRFGYEIVYQHPWGEWSRRYSALDHTQNRPIHRNMTVAPPGSKMVVRKITKEI